MESGIPLEYLRDLQAGYNEFIDDISRTIPVLKVNWESFRTADEMANMIKREFENLQNIRPIDWKDHKPADEISLKQKTDAVVINVSPQKDNSA